MEGRHPEQLEESVHLTRSQPGCHDPAIHTHGHEQLTASVQDIIIRSACFFSFFRGPSSGGRALHPF